MVNHPHNIDPFKIRLDSYRLLVEEVKDYAIYLLDLKGHVSSWNIGAERIKGYRAEEVIGKHFSLFYTEQDKKNGRPNRNLNDALREGRLEDEGWRVRKDGTQFWANVILTRLEDYDGSVIGLSKITRDLTERKISEEKFRLLVSGVEDYAIFMLDPQGRVANWNQGAERIKGYRPDEIIGKHFSLFYPAEDLAWNKPAYELEKASELGRFEDEGWRLRKDGSRFWANVVITRIRNDQGEIIGFSKVTRDLTERRAAEERLRKSQAQLSAAQKIAHVGSWEWDLPDRRLTWSDELYRIYGLSPHEEKITYERYLKRVHPDDRAFIEGLLERAFQSLAPFSFTHRIIRPDGAVRFLHALGEVILSEEGKPIGMLGTGQDITERKETEDEIRRLNADLERRVAARTTELEEANRALRQRTIEAEEANRLKSQFVSNVSHELRTPLNAILGYANLLEDGIFGPLMDYQKQSVQGILRNAADLLHLIEEVLDLSRMEVGKLQVQVGPVDLGTVVEEAIAGVKPLIDQRSLYIDYKAEPNLPTLESDGGKIKQVVINLLSNAVKFTSQGGITVTARNSPEKGGLEVSVRDTGIGIESEALPKIFDAFYQLDAGLTREAGGVGLGLKIVKELIHLLHGEIRVESEVGKGSLFTFFVPYRHSSPS